MTNQPAPERFASIPTDTELPQPRARHDGWTPEKQVTFLEALARTGNVVAAAAYTGMSRESAYKLKRRSDAAAFAHAWDAALIHARDLYQEKLLECAYNGWEEDVWHGGEVVGTRSRWSPPLFLAALNRLDKKADDLDMKGNPARAAAGRFDELIEAIGAGDDCEEMIAEIEATAKPIVHGISGPSDAELMKSLQLSHAREAILATPPEDIDTSDLDPQQMEDWDDLQWERANRSGFLDKIGFYSDESGEPEDPMDSATVSDGEAKNDAPSMYNSNYRHEGL